MPRIRHARRLFVEPPGLLKASTYTLKKQSGGRGHGWKSNPRGTNSSLELHLVMNRDG